MDIQNVVRSQFQASLEMLKQAVEKCPEVLWNHPDDKTKFWQIAYHALFYTHLYLQKSIGEFKPWAKHKEKAESLGPRPADPDAQDEPYKPFSQAELLEYLSLCQQQTDEKTAELNWEAESGFYWLPFNKLELQLYSLRHLQQHTGELMERLGTRASIEVDWVGMKHD